MTCEITLRTMADAKQLNDVALDYGKTIQVSKGLTYVDARSILGLLALIGEKVNLVFPDHAEPEKVSRVMRKIEYLL